MKKKARLLLLLTLFPFVFAGNGFAQDVEIEEIVAPEEPYVFPEIPPEVHLRGGPRLVNVSGSERTEEYEYLHDSVMLGGELRVFSFPHRIYLDIDFKDKKDYFGDVNYAYKDIVLFRGINRTLFHNLDNVTLIDLDPSTSSPGVDVRDSGEKYGVTFNMTTLFFRLKTPDFPFHVYLDGTLIRRDGSQQQMSLLGSGFFDNLVRTSQKRSIDWESRNIIIGVNSHLGPVEVDFSHGEKRFDAEGGKVLFDPYTPAIDDLATPPTLIRPGGVFPHNLIPDLKGSSNTLKFHTSYTGGLVASATFSRVDRENQDSGAKANYFIGAGEVTWIPMPRLAVFVKYRHKDADINNPDAVSIADASNPSSVFTYPVRPSVSSNTDTATATVRYRPLSGLTLRAEYSYEHVQRENADAWQLPQSTTRNIASLSADLRVLKGLTLKAKYTHKQIDDPAYNSEPNRADEGRISVSWIPFPMLNALVSYGIGNERRNNLRFLDEEGNLIENGPQNRDVRRQRLLGSITVLPLKDVSVTASYTYISDKIQQDIAMGAPPLFPLVVDPMVAYKDTAQNYALDISYIPKNSISVGGGISYTISRGTFFPSSPDFTEPVSIPSFSDLKVRETACSLFAEYKFKSGFVLGARYKYSNIKDLLDNPNDDVQNGMAHIIMATISKRWK